MRKMSVDITARLAIEIAEDRVVPSVLLLQFPRTFKDSVGEAKITDIDMFTFNVVKYEQGVTNGCAGKESN